MNKFMKEIHEARDLGDAVEYGGGKCTITGVHFSKEKGVFYDLEFTSEGDPLFLYLYVPEGDIDNG